MSLGTLRGYTGIRPHDVGGVCVHGHRGTSQDDIICLEVIPLPPALVIAGLMLKMVRHTILGSYEIAKLLE